MLLKQTDPNGLVTERRYDGFGRLGLEKRPDGSQTTIALSRTQDGGRDKKAWRVMQRTTTSGGNDETVEQDSLGRPFRWWWFGPYTAEPPGSPPRLMQEVRYDRLSGKVARRSVPVSEDTPEAQLVYDAYSYDALGREVRHRTPWGEVVETAYDASRVLVTDALGNATTTENDALGRPVAITDAAKGVTSYTYGPFGALDTVTDPGGAVTRTTRDAFGRVRKLDDPDRGTTVQVYDGFGELISSTDALGRVSTFEYDGLGRTISRTDQKGAELLKTIWKWDTAENGIGKLHTLTSPDAVKTSSYNALGQIESLALTISGDSESFTSSFTYGSFGRLATLTYPSPNGAAPFAVAHEYDAHGHLLAVRDSATDVVYWRLTEVDTAGRFQEEVFGNGIVTERSYFADKQHLKSIATRHGSTAVQSLAYDYDARLNLTSRTDTLQPQFTTERFRYDALARLTCAYFSLNESSGAPCALKYGYSKSGNLTLKSDVGVLSYSNPAHPHAVTKAGDDSFGYDAVGNQTKRPAGVTVSYTPFDLPRALTEGASAVTFGYDGDHKRIRKTTPDAETLYLGDLYERVTEMASGSTEHRYRIHSPERVVAIVTRGGKDPGVRYVHVDHLGSVDALTDEDGAVVERRSYDSFGARRNPVWGQPTPASFTSKTTKGFTGHESDDELGLVNMKGRVYDPKIGRFLTTDPIVSNPWNGQSFNAYSYVLNNPLSLVDPSGLWEEPPGTPPLLPGSDNKLDSDGHLTVWVFGEPRRPRESEGTEAAVEVGAAAPTSDVDTTGSSSEPELVLPIVELPHATGPGSADPFGIQPRALAVGYDRPLSLLDQLLTGDPAGGRTTFLLPFESGFFRDLSIALADDLRVVTLRPTISDFPPQDPRDQAIDRLIVSGILTVGAFLTPGPQDDLALAGGAAGSSARRGAAAEVRMVSPRILRATEELSSKSQVAKMSKLMGGEKGFGPFNPIDAIESEGVLYISDGHHRAAAAARAGLHEVPVRVQPVSSTEEAQHLFRSWASTLNDKGF